MGNSPLQGRLRAGCLADIGYGKSRQIKPLYVQTKAPVERVDDSPALHSFRFPGPQKSGLDSTGKVASKLPDFHFFLAQYSPQHLSHNGGRQTLPELHFFRTLVPGQLLPAKLDDFVGNGFGSRCELNKRLN